MQILARPWPLLHDLRVNPLCEHKRCGCMPQTVKPYARLALALVALALLTPGLAEGNAHRLVTPRLYAYE